MSTERNNFEWSFKQMDVENNDCGILAEQAGPIVHLTESEVETLGATLEAMRGHEPCDRELKDRVELDLSTVLCVGAARLARASKRGELQACDRLMLSLLRLYSRGQLNNQEAEIMVSRFNDEHEIVQDLTNRVESLPIKQLEALKDQLDKEAAKAESEQGKPTEAAN